MLSGRNKQTECTAGPKKLLTIHKSVTTFSIFSPRHVSPNNIRSKHGNYYPPSHTFLFIREKEIFCADVVYSVPTILFTCEITFAYRYKMHFASVRPGKLVIFSTRALLHFTVTSLLKSPTYARVGRKCYWTGKIRGRAERFPIRPEYFFLAITHGEISSDPHFASTTFFKREAISILFMANPYESKPSNRGISADHNLWYGWKCSDQTSFFVPTRNTSTQTD